MFVELNVVSRQRSARRLAVRSISSSENLQDSGSFKLRGVINKILSLSDEDSRKFLVAASTGNHGAAFAHALQLFGLRGKLFMPKTSAPVKVENVRSMGVPFELVGEDCIEAETHAAAFARSEGHVWISPYNDLEVVHGQGTVAVELVEQLEKFDAVLVPVGGGGLISGIACYLNAVDPSIEVIGCQPREFLCDVRVDQGRGDPGYREPADDLRRHRWGYRVGIGDL